MILILWIMLLILPCIIGVGIMTIVYRKKQKCRIGLSDGYLLGCIACIGIIEVAHVLGLFGGLALTKTRMLFTLLLTGVTVVSFLIGVHGYFKEKNRYKHSLAGEAVTPALPIVVLVLAGIQALFIYCMKAPVTSGDITLETVQSFLAEDGIYKVMPLTGMVSEQGMPLRYTILCLPTMYAVLSQGFGIEPELLVCHIVPIVVLAAAYLAYHRLSETLFGRGRLRERFLFLLVVAVILCVSDGAVFMDGYGALHGGYMGTSIRNLVLVPYTLCAALEGRWWKAVLCILAEACITWTFMGCGVCVVITLGILILIILEKRFPAISKYLQFFRSKEEQL